LLPVMMSAPEMLALCSIDVADVAD